MHPSAPDAAVAEPQKLELRSGNDITPNISLFQLQVENQWLCCCFLLNSRDLKFSWNVSIHVLPLIQHQVPSHEVNPQIPPPAHLVGFPVCFQASHRYDLSTEARVCLDTSSERDGLEKASETQLFVLLPKSHQTE
ncbi:hypothetical protein ATANTOWER_000264 [Ataeniobius toweri]|uniref:Uncharacterized protein n=1 Tax=Ataeniobius toweri TaxID=208326 RepID=A0ABU7BYV2_9TELE|nr:hypothetical protein [Ataeniobius toweri]